MKDQALGVGLISGTSADGIDVAIVELSGIPPELSVNPRYFETVPFQPQVREAIFQLFDYETASVRQLGEINILLGDIFADAVLQVIDHAGIDLETIDFISSHGQTIYHAPQPEEICGRLVRPTLQIGEAAVISERTGKAVVSDFRVRDMAAGGEGAPLVSFVDRLLFSRLDEDVIVANIGGISNVTLLPAQASHRPIIAFDTGPGNMLIDGLVKKWTNGSALFDRDGLLARQGKVDQQLLKRYLNLPYFSEQPPKSTGRELFGEKMAVQWWEEGEARGLSTPDLIATAAELTIRTFCDAIDRFLLAGELRSGYPVSTLYIGGGGAHNPVLMQGIQTHFPALEVLPQDATLISSDAKEAIAFAILGYECLHRRPNNVPSATGARHLVVMGKVTQ